MTETRVVNVKHGDKYDVYIGRWNPSYKLTNSRFANPFKIGRDGDRDEVLRLYRERLLLRPDLLREVYALQGKVLACWCAPVGGITTADPYVCHGQILAEIADGL